jgi:hypothetical protein
MMISKYASNLLIDAIRQNVAFTPPATYYIAFLTAQPDANDGYVEIGNSAANGYARQAYTATAANWAATNGAGTTNSTSAGNSRTTSNNNAIVFPNPSGGNWFNGAGPAAQNITYIALFDSATIGAGNLWFYVPCPSKSVVQTDTAPTIPAGGLSLVLDQ